MRVPTQHQESESDGGDSCQIVEDQARDRSAQQQPDIGKGGSTRQGNSDQAGMEADSRPSGGKPIRLEHHGPIGVDIVKHQPRFGGYGPPDDVIKAKYHRSSVNPDPQRLPAAQVSPNTPAVAKRLHRQQMLEQLNTIDKQTQANAVGDGQPQQVQMRSVASQKDAEATSPTMCGKRMRRCMVKGKKTLLSPTASLVRQRS
jgi:hypothetical protein